MIDFENTNREEVFEYAFHGEMAILLIQSMNWEEEYHIYKQHQRKLTEN